MQRVSCGYMIIRKGSIENRHHKTMHYYSLCYGITVHEAHYTDDWSAIKYTVNLEKKPHDNFMGELFCCHIVGTYFVSNWYLAEKLFIFKLCCRIRDYC